MVYRSSRQEVLDKVNVMKLKYGESFNSTLNAKRKKQIMMKWNDTLEIAIALEEAHPGADNVNLRYTDLRDWILGLEGFEGKADGCSEKILEAIQTAWMEERE